MQLKRFLVVVFILSIFLYIKAPIVSADIVILQDGRALEGEITKQSRHEITIKTKAGIEVTVERDEVERIVTKDNMKDEYLRRAEKVRKDDEFKHMELAKWCKDNGLKDEYIKELEEVLRINPKNQEAQKQLDLLKGDLAESIKKELDESKPKPGIKKPEEEKQDSETPVTKVSSPGETAAGKQTPGEDAIADPDAIDPEILKGGKGSPKKPEKTKKILQKAIAYLVANQKGGRWDCGMSGLNGQVVTTSFCALALMAAGSTPNKGPYSSNVLQAVKFVRENITRIQQWEKEKKNGKNMSQENWRWGIGGIFLAEAYMHYKDPAIKAKLQEVVQKIEESMEPSGGFGHGPGGPNMLDYVELEVVSNWTVATLGMAKQIGCKVDKEKHAKALDYIAKCTNGAGGVAYSTRPGQVGAGCPGRTGGAILAYSMSKNNAPIVSKMAEYLKRTMAEVPKGHASPVTHFFGAALGSVQISSDVWDTFVTELFPYIFDQANPDGSFRVIKNQEGEKDASNGPFYTSGVLTLMLALDEGRLKLLSGKYAREKKKAGGGVIIFGTKKKDKEEAGKEQAKPESEQPGSKPAEKSPENKQEQEQKLTKEEEKVKNSR